MDILKDKAFNIFISEGNVRENGDARALDPNIRNIVYYLWKSQLVKTLYGSCSGHIGTQTVDGVTSAIYHEGHLYFNENNATFETVRRSADFISVLEGFVSQHPFVIWRNPNRKNAFTDNYSMEVHILGGKRVSDVKDNRDSTLPECPEKQLIEAGYKKMLDFWKGMEKLTIEYCECQGINLVQN